MSIQKSQKFLYFAYGSNLLAHRIHLNNPSAERAGIGCLNDYQINFTGYSKKWKGAVSTIVPKKSKVVWGAIWQLDKSDMKKLDRQEGVEMNIYKVLQVDLILPNGTKVNARSYQHTATSPDIIEWKELPQDFRPSVPYWQVILKGAEESGLPKEYQEFLRQIPHNGYNGPIDIELPKGLR